MPGFIRLTTATLGVALALGLPAMVMADGDSISKVNGSIQVAPGQHAGDISTVNGDITLGQGASADDVGTVNGGVTLQQHAQATRVHTVNGTIDLASASRIAGDARTVNGDIHLNQDAAVSGQVISTNGTIKLDAAQVGNGIETVNSDVDIGANSQVHGGLLVNKPGGWFHVGMFHRVPHVVIGPHAVVQGTLEFRQPVVLEVSDSAQIGPVKGATPVRFSGAAPRD